MDDLTGMTFGTWAVVKQVPSKFRWTRWLLRCQCGQTRLRHYHALKRSNGLPCDCAYIGRKHGWCEVVRVIKSKDGPRQLVIRCTCGAQTLRHLCTAMPVSCSRCWHAYHDPAWPSRRQAVIARSLAGETYWQVANSVGLTSASTVRGIIDNYATPKQKARIKAMHTGQRAGSGFHDPDRDRAILRLRRKGKSVRQIAALLPNVKKSTVGLVIKRLA